MLLLKAFLPPPLANGESKNMPIGPSLNFPLSSASSQMMNKAPPSLYSSDSRMSVLLKPGIGSQRIICRFVRITRRHTLVPVMAQVWCNEVVPRHGMVGQISRQLVVGPDVRDTFGRLWIQPIVD